MAKIITMDRYAAIRAMGRVKSYYFPRPHESALSKEREPFERAKEEWLKHARAAINEVETFTFEDFLKVGISHIARRPDQCGECGQQIPNNKTERVA
jgi:hypothetical protein